MKNKLFFRTSPDAKTHGFTLVELLIVLTILAILGVATVLILNPAEILKKSRDTQRISDLNSMKSALALYLTTAATPILEAAADTLCVDGTGNDSIWLSFPSDLTQPDGGAITDASFPGSFAAWVQKSESAGGAVDGTGWVPVNLNDTTGGASISSFPVDPNHNCATACLADLANTALMYRYACNKTTATSRPNTFEIDAKMESSYYTTAPNNVAAQDGGNNSNLLEVGTNLTILPDGTTGF